MVNMVNYRQDKEAASKKAKSNRPNQAECAQVVRPSTAKAIGRKSNNDLNSNKGGPVHQEQSANTIYVGRQEQQDPATDVAAPGSQARRNETTMESPRRRHRVVSEDEEGFTAVANKKRRNTSLDKSPSNQGGCQHHRPQIHSTAQAQHDQVSQLIPIQRQQHSPLTKGETADLKSKSTSKYQSHLKSFQVDLSRHKYVEVHRN